MSQTRSRLSSWFSLMGNQPAGGPLVPSLTRVLINARDVSSRDDREPAVVKTVEVQQLRKVPSGCGLNHSDNEYPQDAEPSAIVAAPAILEHRAPYVDEGKKDDGGDLCFGQSHFPPSIR
jgi:hypothetical protein